MYWCIAVFNIGHIEHLGWLYKLRRSLYESRLNLQLCIWDQNENRWNKRHQWDTKDGNCVIWLPIAGNERGFDWDSILLHPHLLLPHLDPKSFSPLSNSKSNCSKSISGMESNCVHRRSRIQDYTRRSGTCLWFLTHEAIAIACFLYLQSPWHECSGTPILQLLKFSADSQHQRGLQQCGHVASVLGSMTTHTAAWGARPRYLTYHLLSTPSLSHRSGEEDDLRDMQVCHTCMHPHPPHRICC